MPKKQQYWLMKSEPGDYSISDLERDTETIWDGVRNYQARNLMRDAMQVGDKVLYYHSNAKPPGVVGIAEVSKGCVPDPTQFDRRSKYFDEKSTKDKPRWECVSIRHIETFDAMISLAQLRDTATLEGMALLRKGQRLSVQPVTSKEWKIILKLAGVKA